MASTWLESLKSAQKTCLIQDGRRKIHFTFAKGGEMAEEYDINTNELLVRKWNKKCTLRGGSNWEFEVGEDISKVPKQMEAEGMMLSASNPIFARKDTKAVFQWRIRNLPYSIDTYQVTADSENRQIIIRTSNKKYYKKFNIPDMDRVQAAIKQDDISIAHANNTLIISYKKPSDILLLEKSMQEEFKKMKSMKDGDMDCNPS